MFIKIIWNIAKFVVVTYLWWTFPLQMALSLITILGLMALIFSFPTRRQASKSHELMRS